MYKEDILTQISVSDRINSLEQELNELKSKISQDKSEDSVNIICFSGDWDKLYASLTIANGALALGKEVHLFFTFWAISILKEDVISDKNNSFLQRILTKLLPCRPGKARLSKFNMFGIGKICINQLLKQKRIDNIDVLYKDVVELGANIHVCETSAQMFGFDCEKISGKGKIDRCGVTTLLSNSFKGKITLFI